MKNIQIPAQMWDEMPQKSATVTAYLRLKEHTDTKMDVNIKNYDHLLEILQISRVHMYRTLKKLVAQGWIIWSHNPDFKGDRIHINNSKQTP